MRIHVLLLLAVAIIGITNAKSKEDVDEADVYYDEGDSPEQISTTLKIEGDGRRKKTEITPEVISTALKLPEKREKIGAVSPTRRSISLPKKLATTKTTNDSTTTKTPNSSDKSDSRINATRELSLPDSEEIKKVITNDATEETPEILPEPQELRFLRPGMNRRRPYYRSPPRRSSPSVNRRNVYPDSQRTRPRRPVDPKRAPTENECTFFSKTVCLEAVDYPHEAILRSIRNNKDMVTALLTDYKPQESLYSNEEFNTRIPFVTKYDHRHENRYDNRFEQNEIKRKYDYPSASDNTEEGFTCPSVVKYARPQLARAASGIWKYIINTGEHTQTLRLEKCMNPTGSCSFISENYRSSCSQVYNYHRLLTWDSKLGLHMDIFKVPTCCSCQVHGYADIFPPHMKDPPVKPQEPFPGADFSTDHKNNFGYGKPPSFLNKFKTSSSTFDAPSNSFSDSFGNDEDEEESLHYPSLQSYKKPQVDSTVNRPAYSLPGRQRPKKPSSIPRPFDKLPQQHAPNTRAPGYTGAHIKNSRPSRPSRPYRRESTWMDAESAEGSENYPRNTTLSTRFSQPYGQDVVDPNVKLHSGFDDEYHDTHKSINFDYHPIIEFFKPEAAMLQSEEQKAESKSFNVSETDSGSWKPMILP